MSWFFIQTEIPRRLFSFLHPPHRAWQHKQGLHPTEGTNKSLLQVEPTHIKRILTCWAIESKLLNVLRFYNLLYYRGRGILLIRNPFLAIISMFRQISYCCLNLRGQAVQQFSNIVLISMLLAYTVYLCRHQKFGHHSQSEFSQRRHKMRPRENQHVGVLSLFKIEQHHCAKNQRPQQFCWEGILHGRISRLCQREYSALERNHWGLGSYCLRTSQIYTMSSKIWIERCDNRCFSHQTY